MSASMALLDRGGSVVMVEKHHSGTVGKVGVGYLGGDGSLVCVRIMIVLQYSCSTKKAKIR